MLPAWSLLQFPTVLVMGALVGVGIGRIGAGCVVVMFFALQGTDVGSDNALFGIFLPSLALLCGATTLMCVVAAFPSLGQKIEHGPFGPGGI